MAGQKISPATSAISGNFRVPTSGKSPRDQVLWTNAARKTKKTVSGSMKKLVSEDITQERLSWIIECIDEMFSDLDENENDTY
jgi:hypothetical protein